MNYAPRSFDTPSIFIKDTNALYEQAQLYAQVMQEGIQFCPKSQCLPINSRQLIETPLVDYQEHDVDEYLNSQEFQDVILQDFQNFNSDFIDQQLKVQFEELNPQRLQSLPKNSFTTHSKNADVLLSCTLDEMEILSGERLNSSSFKKFDDNQFYQECVDEAFSAFRHQTNNIYNLDSIRSKSCSINCELLQRGIHVLQRILEENLYQNLDESVVMTIKGCFYRIQIIDQFCDNSIFDLLQMLTVDNYLELISAFDFNKVNVIINNQFYQLLARTFEPTELPTIINILNVNGELITDFSMKKQEIIDSFAELLVLFDEKLTMNEMQSALLELEQQLVDAQFEEQLFSQLVIISMAYYVIRNNYVQDMNYHSHEPDLVDTLYNPHCQQFFSETDIDFCQDIYKKVLNPNFYSDLTYSQDSKIKLLDRSFDIIIPQQYQYLLSNRGNIFTFNQFTQAYEADLSQYNQKQSQQQHVILQMKRLKQILLLQEQQEQLQTNEVSGDKQFILDTEGALQKLSPSTNGQIMISSIPTSNTSLSGFYHQKTTEIQRMNVKNMMKSIQLSKQKMLRRFRVNKNSNCINSECTRLKKLINDFDSVKRKLLFEGRPVAKKRWISKSGSNGYNTQQNSVISQRISQRLEETEEQIKNLTVNLIKEGGQNVGNGLQIEIFATPQNFQGVLKNYQKLGFSWLANMHSQNLSCLLCDQMGLGKTIQIIAYFLHLCEKENTFGPFLVICPNSLLNNWVSEMHRFAPLLHTWPYWGNPQQRQTIRSGWQHLIQMNNLIGNQLIDENQIGENELFGYQECPLHVVITSYALAVADIKHLSKIPWYSIVLDEGQMIKSSETKRWFTIMQYQAQNKILLSGTPIQNTLSELWSLLHFVQPQVFSNKESFAEWFSKDLEVAISGNLNNIRLSPEQLLRLQQILAPFVLRREKKDVAQQLGDKTEIEVYCDLSSRQKLLYNGIKQKINVSELFQNQQQFGDDDQLRNIIMQLRKVVNHPQIFEKSLVKCPFILQRQCHQSTDVFDLDADDDEDTKSMFSKTDRTKCNESITCSQIIQKDLQPTMPKLKPRELLFEEIAEQFCSLSLDDRVREVQLAKTVMFSRDSAFEFVIPRLVQRSFLGLFSTFEQISTLCYHLTSETIWQSSHLEVFGIQSKLAMCLLGIANSLLGNENIYGNSFVTKIMSKLVNMSQILEFFTQNQVEIVQNIKTIFDNKSVFEIEIPFFSSLFNLYQHAALGFMPKIYGECLPRARLITDYQFNNIVLKQINLCSLQLPRIIQIQNVQNYLFYQGPRLLIEESGKLRALDKLLDQLYANKQPVLIFCQMTKMMDILEDYLAFKRFGYVRLDGSTSIAERRQVVDKFMTDQSIFAFILSTRAGSLGLNLTRASNVIFYESDWNPTSDLQASDRVHRIGQTKNVQIYKIICKNTVDERIMKRAQEKIYLQKLVMDGQQRDENGNLINVDRFKKKTVREEMMDLLQE